ncbi:hypothetical protein Hanom_Chr08g00722701 [Helianthus anomalus]
MKYGNNKWQRLTWRVFENWVDHGMDLILWCEAVHMIFGWLVGGGGYKLHMDGFNTTVFFLEVQECIC